MPSTKTAVAAVASVAGSDKVLVVIHRDEDIAQLGLRNAATVHAISVDQLNAYDVLANDDIVFTRPHSMPSSPDRYGEVCQGSSHGRASRRGGGE